MRQAKKKKYFKENFSARSGVRFSTVSPCRLPPPQEADYHCLISETPLFTFSYLLPPFSLPSVPDTPRYLMPFISRHPIHKSVFNALSYTYFRIFQSAVSIALLTISSNRSFFFLNSEVNLLSSIARDRVFGRQRFVARIST